MAPADKKNKKKQLTPGRPAKKGNQYWDIGKVGRKTGITLEDKGIRDEHGLEPVDHIFSSPVKNADGTLESSDMLVQQSSGPDVDMTLASRKTPRMPPPRASTPKHTNIGSPKRMSTGRPNSQPLFSRFEQDLSPSHSRTQPPANRVLDFGADVVRQSIETASPFKPKHVIRRSSVRPDLSASPSNAAQAGVEEAETVEGAEDDSDVQPLNDEPVMQSNDDYYDAMPHQPSEEVEEAQIEDITETAPRSARARRSGDLINGNNSQQATPVASMNSGKKRDRSILDEESAENERSILHSQLSESGPVSKKQRSKQPKNDKVVIHHRNGEDETIDPALLAHGDEYEQTSTLEAALDPANNGEGKSKGKGKGKGKGKKGGPPKERDANRAMGAPSDSVGINDSPSKLRNSREGSSMGPMNLYHLRATTPFEDAGQRTSRYGRNLIQPLKYWANETRILRNGDTEGIIRAEEVEVPKRKGRKRGGRRKGHSQLGDIPEESETESVMADDWEEEVGVISGTVANWDPEKQVGDSEDLIYEDIGFASSSIVTRDVANSEFKYAKIMTLPFFGAGVVELPPNGFKRTKSSRKMQMCFLVHEGKVKVEVGPANVQGAATQFTLAKGGSWVVPRGNNYSIANASKTTTALVFFAQGCEIDAATAAAAATAAEQAAA